MDSYEGPPIVTLTTDFGLKDHYVGTMKGVILSRCPRARVADITHEIPPFSIVPAAYAISQAAPYYPRGTIHVVVIDPGVGTERKGLAAAAKGQLFIAPDNGVLDIVLARDPDAAIHELTNTKLWLPEVSSTFHGRDIFSAVAAALAGGQAQLADVGPPITQIVRLEGLQPVETSPGLWRGRVLSIDHFGNVITNFLAEQFTGSFSLAIKAVSITRVARTFGEAPAGEPFAYPGSSGYIELAINQHNFAARFGTEFDDALTLTVLRK